MPHPTRILVTGGAGMIGSRVVRLLAARGAQVVVVDNGMVGMPLPAATAQVRPFAVDIRDKAAMAAVCAETQPEAIIHLAALHLIPHCERDPHLAYDINILGTQVVLDAATQQGIHRLVLASSAAVYDFWETALIEDETPLRATDVYSTSKLTNEHQVRLWAEKHGGRATLARIFNVIAHDDPNGHIIPDILKQVMPSGDHVALGNTAPKRDYTHADDTAAGVIALLDHLESGAPVEAYNVSFGQEYSVVDLVEAIGACLGRTLTITHDPARVRKVDRLHLLGDTRKMQRVTGWHAEIAFAEALRRIVEKLVTASEFDDTI